MRLPWQENQEKKEKIERLEEELEKVKEEKSRVENQLESEKERRSKLSREKQEAEEELNRLKDKLENLKEDDEDEESTEDTVFENTEFKEIENTLRKIESIESPEKDLITIYEKDSLEEVPDSKGLKNTLNSEDYSRYSLEENLVVFTDGGSIEHLIKTRPFFEPNWKLDEKFRPDKILEFMEEEKIWALVAAGETKIFREKSQRVEEVDRIKMRVDNKQKKGGFSQDRFENKREEQIQGQVKQTKEVLKELENVKLLGNRKICKELPGEYLGGFDSSKKPSLDLFYNFRINK